MSGSSRPNYPGRRQFNSVAAGALTTTKFDAKRPADARFDGTNGDCPIGSPRLVLATRPRGSGVFDELERRLASAPQVSVPTLTLEGDADAAPHLDPAAYARKFSGKYLHRLVTGGIGHNLPQEAPQAFSQAVIDVSRS